MITLFQKSKIFDHEALFWRHVRLVRHHLDYGDIIYDIVFNESFHNKIETVQYNPTFAMTGGNNTETLYKELDLESL